MKHKVFGALSLAVLVLSAGCKVNQPSAATPPQSAVQAKAQQAAPAWLPEEFSYKPSKTKLHDLQHTSLKVRFDWEKQYLHGQATITVKPHFYPQQELVLDARGFDIHDVAIISGGTEKTARYTYDKEVLVINLERTFTRNETYKVFIEYTAKPNELAAGGSSAITSDKGLYFINPLGEDKNKPTQIWTQGETEASSAWFPTIDATNQRQTQDIYITVHPKFTTLSNGTLIYSKKNADGTKTDYWKMDKPHAPYLAMMAIGEFAVVKDKWRKLDVDYYVEPAYKNTAKAVFGNTPEMMEFFSQKLGVDYPWDKYAQVVVRDYVSGAMENTSASLFMEALQLDSRELLDKNWDDIIAHELFHQWFGDYVTMESWANLPLNESFADYSEYLWAEYKYGPDAAALIQQKALSKYLAEASSKRVPLIRYHHNRPDDMFDSHSYEKGGRVLHMLRTYVGDDAFYASLNRYLTLHKFSAVEIDELRMAFEDVTGEDLHWFFNQWFLHPGHPELVVSHSYQNGNLRLQVKQTQDPKYSPVYRLPVTVSVWVNDKRQDIPVDIKEAGFVTEIPVAAAPQLVIFDAKQHLLATVNHQKTDQELLYQFHYTNQFMPKMEAMVKLKAALNKPEVLNMMQKALNDDFWYIRSTALNLLAGYNGTEAAVIKSKARQMALTDNKSQVRADAIDLLTSFKGEDFKEVYVKALQDSSYMVAGAAIQAYAAANPSDLGSKLAQFENSKNADIISSLAEVYARTGNASKNDWFIARLDKSQGSQLYYLVQAYGNYLLKLPPAEQQKGIRKLADIARNHNAYFVRIAAFKALSIQPETQDQKNLLKTIQQNEKDERVLDFYKQVQ